MGKSLGLVLFGWILRKVAIEPYISGYRLFRFDEGDLMQSDFGAGFQG